LVEHNNNSTKYTAHAVWISKLGVSLRSIYT